MFKYTSFDNPLKTQDNQPAGFGMSEKYRRANDTGPFDRSAAAGYDDDLARATIQPANPDRHTFG